MNYAWWADKGWPYLRDKAWPAVKASYLGREPVRHLVTLVIGIVIGKFVL